MLRETNKTLKDKYSIFFVIWRQFCLKRSKTGRQDRRRCEKVEGRKNRRQCCRKKQMERLIFRNLLNRTVIELHWENHGSFSRTSVWATTSSFPFFQVTITKAPLTPYHFCFHYRQNKCVRWVPTAQCGEEF